MQLMIEGGPSSGKSLTLVSSDLTVGRGEENDLVLSEQAVSRHHARLQRQPDGWHVVDLGSTNGTFVDRQRLQPHTAHPVVPGSRVTIGNSVLVLSLGEAQVQHGLDSLHPVRHRSSKPNLVLLVLGVVCLLVLLVGAVLVLVTVLQSGDAPPTATAVQPAQQLLTALPLPTGLDSVVTAVVPLLPTGMTLPFLGGTPTPTP